MTKNSQKLAVINGLKGIEASLDLIKSQDFNDKYALLCATIKQLQDLKKDVDKEIADFLKKQYMSEGEGKVSTDKYSFIYIPGTTRECVDSKKLKAEYPNIYKEVVKISRLPESFRATEHKEKKEIESH